MYPPCNHVSKGQTLEEINITITYTVLLQKIKLFIYRSCPILVSTTVIIRPCQTDAKNDVENYPIITPRENAVRKYQSFPPDVFKFQCD